jgi:hypothetical protein
MTVPLLFKKRSSHRLQLFSNSSRANASSLMVHKLSYFLELGFDTALAMHLSHNVFSVAHGRKSSKNAEDASSFFLPSNISFIAKAGLVIFFFPKVDILPEVWNQS